MNKRWSQEEDNILRGLCEMPLDPITIAHRFNRTAETDRPARGVIQRAIKYGFVSGAKEDLFRRVDSLLQRNKPVNPPVEETTSVSPLPVLSKLIGDPKCKLFAGFLEDACAAMQDSDIQHVRLYIGPDEARALLEGPIAVTDPHNRKINDGRVRAYASDMARNEWKDTGVPVVVTVDRVVVDGQHRLHAVIASGAIVPMTVAFNVQNDAVPQIDIGAPRPLHEIVRREGVENARDVVSWSNIGHLIMKGYASKFTPSEHALYRQQYADALVWGVERASISGPYKKMIVTAALVFAHPYSSEAVTKFYELLNSNDQFATKSPITAARSLIMSIPAKREDRRVVAVKILRCIQAFIQNEELPSTHIYATDGAVKFFASAHDKHSILRS